MARIALTKAWGHLVRFGYTPQFRQNGCFGPNTLNRRWSPPPLGCTYARYGKPKIAPMRRAVVNRAYAPPITTKRESKTSAEDG